MAGLTTEERAAVAARFLVAVLSFSSAFRHHLVRPLTR
jgi:hypothetical protein